MIQVDRYALYRHYGAAIPTHLVAVPAPTIFPGSPQRRACTVSLRFRPSGVPQANERFSCCAARGQVHSDAAVALIAEAVAVDIRRPVVTGKRGRPQPLDQRLLHSLLLQMAQGDVVEHPGRLLVMQVGRVARPGKVRSRSVATHPLNDYERF